jgi:hypothetical protein
MSDALWLRREKKIKTTSYLGWRGVAPSIRNLLSERMETCKRREMALLFNFDNIKIGKLARTFSYFLY